MDNFEERFDRGLTTEAVDRPMSPIEGAISELEMSQSELYERVSVLARQLAPVLKRKYDPKEEALAKADAPGRDTEIHSSLVRQVSSCTNCTRSTTEIINFIVNNLEV